MSSPTTPLVDNLLVSTLQKMGRKPFDQIFQKTPTYNWLLKNGRVKWDLSGSSYSEPLTYAVSQAAGVTSGYKTVDTTPNEFIAEAVYLARRLYATVSYSQDEVDKNKADAKRLDLVKQKITQATNTIIRNANTYMYAASVATDAPESFATTIDSTGTLGGLNQSTYGWWASTETACGSFAANGVESVQTMINTLSLHKAETMPNLIVTDQTVFEYFQNQIRAFYGNLNYESSGDLGVPTVRFMNIPVIFDPNCTAGTMYFVNSDSMGLAIDGANNMAMTEMVKPYNQLIKVGQLHIRLQLVCGERRAQGKLTGITA